MNAKVKAILYIVWEALKAVAFFWRPIPELRKRIEELENEIEPFKQQEKQARHDAMEAIAYAWPDKFDNADRRLREAERAIDAAYAKFGLAIHHAYRYKS